MAKFYRKQGLSYIGSKSRDQELPNNSIDSDVKRIFHEEIYIKIYIKKKTEREIVSIAEWKSVSFRTSFYEISIMNINL